MIDVVDTEVVLSSKSFLRCLMRSVSIIIVGSC